MMPMSLLSFPLRVSSLAVALLATLGLTAASSLRVSPLSATSAAELHQCRALAEDYAVSCHLDANVRQYSASQLRETLPALHRLLKDLQTAAKPAGLKKGAATRNRVWELENDASGQLELALAAVRGGVANTSKTERGLLARRENLNHATSDGATTSPFVFPELSMFFGALPTTTGTTPARGSDAAFPKTAVLAALGWHRCLSTRFRFYEEEGCQRKLFPVDQSAGAGGQDQHVAAQNLSHDHAWKTHMLPDWWPVVRQAYALAQQLLVRRRRFFKLRKLAQALLDPRVVRNEDTLKTPSLRTANWFQELATTDDSSDDGEAPETQKRAAETAREAWLRTQETLGRESRASRIVDPEDVVQQDKLMLWELDQALDEADQLAGVRSRAHEILELLQGAEEGAGGFYLLCSIKSVEVCRSV